MDLIEARSTPLHYAACGDNLKCFQFLLVRGANRMNLNYNSWVPLDVARIVLNIARECRLQSSTTCSDDAEICAVCLERICTVATEGYPAHMLVAQPTALVVCL
ncbi:RING-type E3 ubiquitin transferase [Sarracenia purpurea var. burkii]